MFIEYTDEVPGRTNREAVVSFPQNTVLPTADKTDPNSKMVNKKNFDSTAADSTVDFCQTLSGQRTP